MSTTTDSSEMSILTKSTTISTISTNTNGSIDELKSQNKPNDVYLIIPLANPTIYKKDVKNAIKGLNKENRTLNRCMQCIASWYNL